jgi:uncharacterized protein involved in exopolysaccharide biosynthesis/Mrp family chromosome partitioning ATPase
MRVGDAPPDLQDYLGILWRHKWMITAITTIAVAAALLHSLRQEPSYQSSAEVLVQPISTFTGGQSPSPQVVIMEDERRVATSAEVTEMAASGLRRAGVAMGSISVQATETSHSLLLTAVSMDPVSAQETAEAFAKSYLSFRKQKASEDLDAAREPIELQLREVNRQLDALQEQMSSGSSELRTAAVTRYTNLLGLQNSLQQSLNQIVPLSRLGVGEILQPASPAVPAGPPRSRTVALALFVGLALGAGVAFLRDRFDQRVQSRHDLESLTGVPVLAVVPRQRRWSLPSRAVKADAAIMDAYRILARRVLAGSSQRRLTTLMVTSADAEEEKSATTAKLASALAESGKNILVLSAEPGGHRLGRHLSAHLDVVGGEEPGTEDPERLVNPTELDNPWQNLWLIAPRVTMIPLTVSPAVLGTAALRELIEELQQAADILLVDASPMLDMSDVVTLAPVVDAVICVADVRRTRRAVIANGMEELKRTGTWVIGLVLTNSNRHGSAGSPFPSSSANGHRGLAKRPADQYPRQSP